MGPGIHKKVSLRWFRQRWEHTQGVYEWRKRLGLVATEMNTDLCGCLERECQTEMTRARKNLPAWSCWTWQKSGNIVNEESVRKNEGEITQSWILYRITPPKSHGRQKYQKSVYSYSMFPRLGNPWRQILLLEVSPKTTPNSRVRPKFSRWHRK